MGEEDPFYDEDESPSERLARQNMENDLHFLDLLRKIGVALGASERTRADFDKHGDDPRLSDIRRYAHALGISIRHDGTGRVRHLCHCGSHVASWAEPDRFENTNMVDHFCGHCITVRCDAFPGACNLEPMPGTWEHTLATIKAMSKEQLREALIEARQRQEERR